MSLISEDCLSVSDDDEESTWCSTRYLYPKQGVTETPGRYQHFRRAYRFEAGGNISKFLVCKWMFAKVLHPSTVVWITKSALYPNRSLQGIQLPTKGSDEALRLIICLCQILRSVPLSAITYAGLAQAGYTGLKRILSLDTVNSSSSTLP